MPYSVLNFVILDTIFDVVFVTLPYLRGGQALRIPAQCWGHISSAQCASPNVTTRL